MTPSYPEQVLALLNPPIIIQYDERDDILHTPEWPQCKDETCPCNEHAPYEQCSCGSCMFVRQMLEQTPTEQ